MKVLFAVNNENVSEEIVKKYQKDYREIISYKNVYYFNAIIKEMQRDKSYDRIVISEDLEPFANNNYDTIDKFLFEKLDNISDEATDNGEKEAQIILICSDRRSKSDALLVKLFGIGVYSAIIGKDRSIEEVCRLINNPRTKKDAKQYYRIDSEDVNYQVESDTDVNENEIQSILKHYKSLGKNEDKYVESFNNIASQYTDAQLRIIIKFLPINVKAVLETKSPKYQQIVMFGDRQYKRKNTSEVMKAIPQQQEFKKKKNGPVISDENLKIESIEKRVSNPLTGKPIVIPSLVKSEKTVQVERKLKDLEDDNEYRQNNEMRHVRPPEPTQRMEPEPIRREEPIQRMEPEPIRREEPIQRMEPEPIQNEELIEELESEPMQIEESNTGIAPKIEGKRTRGRPKKIPTATTMITNNIEEAVEEPAKRKRGRPKKVAQEIIHETSEDVDLFNLTSQNDEEDNYVLPGIEETEEEDENITLPGLDNTMDEENYDSDDANEQEDDSSFYNRPKFNMGGYNSFSNNVNRMNETPYQANNDYQDLTKRDTQNSYGNDFEMSNLITGDQKVVAFVGSPKNGTSFTVNNLGALFAEMGINTAILDLTESKNSFFIYTKNEENLRKVAYDSIPKLKMGHANGIKVNKNLSVYTELPGEYSEKEDIDAILKTLVNSHNLVLLDCDFNTPFEYFDRAQEIYLVQSMDILTIQPLTAFMRDLKNKGILKPEKLRIVINKATKIRELNDKVLIGGMANYNSPSMSVMTELFNKETVKYCSIPLDVNTYVAYLEGIVICEISLERYSRAFIQSLKELAAMVYPLVNKQNYRPREIGNANQYMPRSRGPFSQGMNSTLEKMNKMKNGY